MLGLLKGIEKTGQCKLDNREMYLNRHEKYLIIIKCVILNHQCWNTSKKFQNKIR